MRVGAAAWILGAILFFACQLIAQAAWTTPYNWAANNVSDLGSVHCQLQGDLPRYVAGYDSSVPAWLSSGSLGSTGRGSRRL